MQGLDTPLTYNVNAGEYNWYTRKFTIALANSVSKAVSTAGGHEYDTDFPHSNGRQAAKWFIDHYPLLGGLASHFKIVEDYRYCHQNDIQIAAIDVTCGELYLNPTAGFPWKNGNSCLHMNIFMPGLCTTRKDCPQNLSMTRCFPI